MEEATKESWVLVRFATSKDIGEKMKIVIWVSEIQLKQTWGLYEFEIV